MLKIGLDNIGYVLNNPGTNGHLGPIAEDFRYILGPNVMGQQ